MPLTNPCAKAACGAPRSKARIAPIYSPGCRRAAGVGRIISGSILTLVGKLESLVVGNIIATASDESTVTPVLEIEAAMIRTSEHRAGAVQTTLAPVCGAIEPLHLAGLFMPVLDGCDETQP